MTTKASGKFKPCHLERGLLGKSDSHLLLPSREKSILVPKPLHVSGIFSTDLRKPTTKRSALSIVSEKNGDSLNDPKRRIVFSNTFDDECTRQVCDEIQHIVQSETSFEGTNLLQFDVLQSLSTDIDFFDCITDDGDISGYSMTPPSRASNPIVSNSAFSEERLENDGAELGIFSISPPSSKMTRTLLTLAVLLLLSTSAFSFRNNEVKDPQEQEPENWIIIETWGFYLLDLPFAFQQAEEKVEEKMPDFSDIEDAAECQQYPVNFQISCLTSVIARMQEKFEILEENEEYQLDITMYILVILLILSLLICCIIPKRRRCRKNKRCIKKTIQQENNIYVPSFELNTNSIPVQYTPVEYEYHVKY